MDVDPDNYRECDAIPPQAGLNSTTFAGYTINNFNQRTSPPVPLKGELRLDNLFFNNSQIYV